VSLADVLAVAFLLGWFGVAVALGIFATLHAWRWFREIVREADEDASVRSLHDEIAASVVDEFMREQVEAAQRSLAASEAQHDVIRGPARLGGVECPACGKVHAPTEPDRPTPEQRERAREQLRRDLEEPC
jgi:hypothetical protein